MQHPDLPRERLDDLPLLIEHFLSERDASEKSQLFTPEVVAG